MKDRRYAVLGDVHGNWEALRAVLEDAAKEHVTDYVCVGDIVGYNADPAKCLEKLRELGTLAVRGNHDHYCSHDECLEDFHPLAAQVIDWTRKQLSDEEVHYLRTLELSRMVAGFCIVHSTLDMPEMWGYVFESLEAEASFNYQMTTVCFYGHTHVPLAFEKAGEVTGGVNERLKISLEKKYLINVGSIGQPRDGDARAAYALYDLVKNEIQLRRVPYDVAAAQEKIRKAGLPERLAARLAIGR